MFQVVSPEGVLSEGSLNFFLTPRVKEKRSNSEDPDPTSRVLHPGPWSDDPKFRDESLDDPLALLKV